MRRNKPDDYDGTTIDRGPGHELRFDDGPGTVVDIDIEARPSRVWELVTDINLPARFSTEFQGADWATAPGAGAVFNGRNHHPAIGDWTVRCYVDTYDAGCAFGWRTSDLEEPGARWRFELEPKGHGTRLRFSYAIGPGWSAISMMIQASPENEALILRERIDEVRGNMQRTIQGIRDLAEGGR